MPSSSSARAPRITLEQYEGLLKLWRKGVRSMASLAKQSGISRETVTKAVRHGWPAHGWPSVEDAWKTEQEAARAASARATEEEARMSADQRELARQDSVAVLLQEARIIGIARSDVGAVLGLAAEMLAPMRVLVAKLKEQLEQHATSGALGVEASMKLVHRYATIIRLGVDATQKIVETERTRRGDPVETTGINAIADMTPEDAIAELSRIGDSMNRARELGLVVLDGGQSGGPTNGTNGTSH